MLSMTNRRRRVLETIQDYTRIYGYPPSLREIGVLVGLKSVSSVAYQVRQLRAGGYLAVVTANRSRAITATNRTAVAFHLVASELDQFLADAAASDTTDDALAGMRAAIRFCRRRAAETGEIAAVHTEAATSV